MTKLTQDLGILAGQWVVRTTTVAVPSGGAAVKLVGADVLRWGLILGNTVDPATVVQTPFSVVAAGASGAAIADLISFTVPAGSTGVLTGASVSNLVGAPTMALQQVRGAGTLTYLGTGGGAAQWNTATGLAAADVIKWAATAAVPATAADVMLTGYTQVVGGAVSEVVTVTPSPAASATLGIPILPGSRLELNYRAYGGLVQREWWAFGRASPGANVTVTEILAQQ